MAIVIWKYTLALKTHQEIILPIGFEILSVQNQHELACIWVRVNDNPSVHQQSVFFTTYSTGDTVDVLKQYVGTYQIKHGQEVYHVYYSIRK